MSIQISDTTPRIQYVAAAAQTRFIIPFSFYSDTDLLVYQRIDGSTPDDAVDILTYTTDYTVNGAGLTVDRYIDLVAAATVNDIITIVRDQPESRSNLYVSGGPFTADAVNADFSRNVMMNQQNELVCKEVSPRYDYNAVIAAADLLMDVLPAGYAWRKNAAGTKIEAFLPTSGTVPVTESLMAINITQGAHGLAVGDIVRPTAAGYVQSQADSVANAEVCGYVSAVTDINNFTLLLGGMITTGLVGLTAEEMQYLDPVNAGQITNVKPVTAGQVVKPVLQAVSVTTGIWANYRGSII